MGTLGRLLLLLFFYPSAQAAVKEFTFFQDFRQNQQLQWQNRPSRDDLLLNLKKTNPELKIIVLDLNAPQFAESSNIQFRDPQITDLSLRYYLNYSQTMVQNVAFYAAPGALVNDDEARPLIQYPLLVIRQNSPLHALLHELGHFFLNEAQRQDLLSFPDNQHLNSMIAGVAEESFVDYILLSYADEFEFTMSEICPRQKYLAQNNQVLKYLISEMSDHSEKLSLADKSQWQEIRHFYSLAYSTQMKWHTECFLWNFKKEDS